METDGINKLSNISKEEFIVMEAIPKPVLESPLHALTFIYDEELTAHYPVIATTFAG